MSNHRTPPKPEYFDNVPEGTCRWCNKEVGLTPTGRISKSRWHKPCLEEYKMLFWPTSTRRAVWKRDKGVCRSCNTQCDRKGHNGWHMDHIKPLVESQGDLSFWRLGNLQTLCRACHIEKTSKEATERAQKRRDLKE